MKVVKVSGFGILALIIVILLCGCMQQSKEQTNATQVSSEQTAKITIKNFAFDPPALNVNAGTTVIWANEDSAPHEIESEGVFSSGTLSKGESFNHTFNNPGTFDYICVIHPSMKGKIIVEQ